MLLLFFVVVFVIYLIVTQLLKDLLNFLEAYCDGTVMFLHKELENISSTS